MRQNDATKGRAGDHAQTDFRAKWLGKPTHRTCFSGAQALRLSRATTARVRADGSARRGWQPFAAGRPAGSRWQAAQSLLQRAHLLCAGALGAAKPERLWRASAVAPQARRSFCRRHGPAPVRRLHRAQTWSLHARARRRRGRSSRSAQSTATSLAGDGVILGPRGSPMAGEEITTEKKGCLHSPIRRAATEGHTVKELLTSSP